MDEIVQNTSLEKKNLYEKLHYMTDSADICQQK